MNWLSTLRRVYAANRRVLGASQGFVQLATVDAKGRGRVRTLSFRGFLGDFVSLPDYSDDVISKSEAFRYTSALCFSTDLRSSKIPDLPCDGEVAWYFTPTRDQFRIPGRVCVHPHPFSVKAPGVDKDVLESARRLLWARASGSSLASFTRANPQFSHPDAPPGYAWEHVFHDPEWLDAPIVVSAEEDPSLRARLERVIQLEGGRRAVTWVLDGEEEEAHVEAHQGPCVLVSSDRDFDCLREALDAVEAAPETLPYANFGLLYVVPGSDDTDNNNNSDADCSEGSGESGESVEMLSLIGCPDAWEAVMVALESSSPAPTLDEISTIISSATSASPSSSSSYIPNTICRFPITPP